MNEQMKEWMKYVQPAEEHDFLRKLEGTWAASGKFWMQPGAPPMESQGRSTNEMLFGGRYLRSSYQGGFAGNDFQGVAIDGYDRVKKKYVGIWIDTMGTGMMVFEGEVDATGTVRTNLADFVDPVTGNVGQSKGVTTILGDDEHRYEMYNKLPGKEFHKTMEIVYRRA